MTSEAKDSQILDLQRKVFELEAQRTAVLTAEHIMALIMVGPIVAAFVILAVIIVYKATTSPATVGPQLDIILVALAILGNPATAAAAQVVGNLNREAKPKE